MSADDSWNEFPGEELFGPMDLYCTIPVYCEDHEDPVWHHMHYYSECLSDGTCRWWKAYGSGDVADTAVDESEIPTHDECEQGHEDYYSYVIEHGEDPLKVIFNKNPPKDEWWSVSIRRGIARLFAVARKCSVDSEPTGRFDDMPKELTDYCQFEKIERNGLCAVQADDEVKNIDDYKDLVECDKNCTITYYRKSSRLDFIAKIQLPPDPMSPSQLAKEASRLKTQ